MNKYVFYSISTFVYQLFSWALYFLAFYGLTYLPLELHHFDMGFISVTIIFFLPILYTIIYYIFISKIFKIEDNLFRHYLFQAVMSFIFNILFTMLTLVLSGNYNSTAPFAGLGEIAYAMANIFFFGFITLILGCRNSIKNIHSTRAGNLTAVAIVTAFILYHFVLPYTLNIFTDDITNFIPNFSSEEDNHIEENLSNNLSVMLRTKDKELPYATQIIYKGGIMGTDYENHTAFIDYTDKTVGFLFNSGIDEFKFYRLTQVTNNEIQHPIQQEWELNGLGKKLTTYYLDEENSHRTIAIRLEMADGTVYMIDDINVDDSGEYLGIK